MRSHPPPSRPASRKVKAIPASPPPSAPPLADADEALVHAALAGDEQALTALLTRYRHFVRAKARPYFFVGADRDDVVQEGMIGLYKAVRDFDSRCGSTFRAFADVCITRQILSAVKAATRLKHTPLNDAVSLHTAAYDDDDLELIERICPAEPDGAEMVVARLALAGLERHCAEILSDLEAEVLRRHVAGESYAEIAAVLDRHVKAVDNALQRVKRKLDAYVSADDVNANC